MILLRVLSSAICLLTTSSPFFSLSLSCWTACLLPSLLSVSLSLLNRRRLSSCDPKCRKRTQLNVLQMGDGTIHRAGNALWRPTSRCVCVRERERERDPHNNQKETKKKPINTKTKTKQKELTRPKGSS